MDILSIIIIVINVIRNVKVVLIKHLLV